MLLKHLLCTIIIVLFNSNVVSSQIPAFPGAEGFGSTTPGGRGGAILFVTNLNDTGPGSLRQALESSGKRIVIFKTGGTIRLKSDIDIDNPYITIAGQTAPGDGILIRDAGIRIRTHDVIVRGLRVRIGDSPDGPDPENRDGFGIANSDEVTRDIILDHCSVSWAIDENIQLYQENYNITIQWCIISEGLRYSMHPEGEHSNGILIGGSGITEDISVHHNLFAHNLRRNPVISRSNTAEIINNVIYNWELGTTIGGNANVIGNVYKAGTNTAENKGILFQSWESPDGLLYVKDNIGPGRETNTGDDWLVVDDNGINVEDHRSLSNVVPLSNVLIHDVDSVFKLVTSYSGAIFPRYDSVDKRIINDVLNNTGAFIDSQNEVGGWPVLDSGVPALDSDNDGMPDSWELSFGFDPNNNDANGDSDNDGYTNIEEYINSIIKMPSSDNEQPAAPVNLRLSE